MSPWADTVCSILHTWEELFASFALWRARSGTAIVNPALPGLRRIPQARASTVIGRRHFFDVDQLMMEGEKNQLELVGDA
jgi:hypothetical protein